MRKVYRVDSSWTVSRSCGRRWHFWDNDGSRTKCGIHRTLPGGGSASFYIEESEMGASKVPEELRCMKNGCKRLWCDEDGTARKAHV